MDILKTYIRTYDSTGKRYRTNDGIVTAVIKSEDTGLAEDAIEWNIGDKNPIKALFDKVAAGTTFIESDPTKTNYLTSDYWVYTNSSSSKNWTIPKYYNESLTSDDSYNGKVDKVSNNYKDNIEVDKIFDEGYTTKGAGHGYGLSLVKKIVDNNKIFSNITEITREVFSQVLCIKYKK